MSEQNVAIRLKDFIEEMGLTNSQFADQCDIPRPSLSQILTGRNKKISDVIVGQIHSAFPRLSILWLLFGEGDMMVEEKKVESKGDELPNLFDDSLESRPNSRTEAEYSNLGGLNRPSNRTIANVNQLDNANSKIFDLQREIEKMRKNPRKVVQITIYYDDSTFETFFPG